MNYGFWIHGELDRGRLAVALAETLALTPDKVDVGDDGDDDRDWDAPVSCTVTSVAGDLHWHLDVYVGEAVGNQPAEPLAAAWLANRLGTVVAYQALPAPPSAFYLVGPDGTRARARIYEDDDAPVVFRIDAVEQPLAALPGLPVAPIPEVIREYRMPTPVRDRLAERSPAIRDFTMRLGAWESMVARLAEGWAPDGWYPADYYREDLLIRDELAARLGSLPESVRADAAAALAEVDARFTDLTHEDGGRALTSETGPLPAGPSARWWWHRISSPLPWQGTPGR
ncbi:hypothetical protein OWR29_26960 [Actinoplanes sp. Pm04-4]|uniref:Uncharacterized protein n=1 Tax=Paractinoplanes pyxinae TaxID=2997416 RepID=A0ABT4B576_9ACTN|nr:hypothetical protein [Actinoplanes pyxinae]MCY1141653.1 hypothetical protein [Actinoplanes pyxinae]